MKPHNKASAVRNSRIVILCLIVIGLQLKTVAQEEETIFSVLNEFTVSLNRTTVSDHETEDRFGFGVGVFHAFFNQKRCNLVVGMEYNRVSQFKKGIGVWRSEGVYDITYNFNNIGIPVYFRVNMGKKVKFFLECGGFGELTIKNPDRTNKVNYGISGGVGLRIPIDRYEVLIKGDYKWGIRDISTVHISTDLYNRYWRFTMGFKINPRKSVVLY